MPQGHSQPVEGQHPLRKSCSYSNAVLPSHSRNLSTGVGKRENPLATPPSEKLTLPVCSDASEELNQCLWIFKHSFNKYLKRWRDNSMPGIAHYPNGA